MNQVSMRRGKRTLATAGRLGAVALLQGALVLFAGAQSPAAGQSGNSAAPANGAAPANSAVTAPATLGANLGPTSTESNAGDSNNGNSNAGGSNAAATPGSVPATATPANTGGANAAAAKLPPANPANYVLGPEDQITVHVFGADDISDKSLQIAADGNVNVPMLGQVHAGGMSVGQFEADLNKRFKTYFKDPQATVTVTDFRSQPVSVAGAVNLPGVVQLRGTRSLMEVISMAGGLRADAGNTVLLTRKIEEGSIPLAGAFTDPSGKYSVAHINLRGVMNASNPGENIAIKKDDVITVDRAQMVYVIGNVAKSGGFVLNDRESISVLQALALAGGVNSTAQTKNARILRAEGGPQRTELPMNVQKIMSGQAPDVALKADDILFIPNSKTKSAALRTMETAINVGTGLAIWRF